MIDLGKIPRAIQSAVGEVCEFADGKLSEFAKETIVDTAGRDTLEQWAATLAIFDAQNKNEQQLRDEIKARFNACASASVSWFYRLAQSVGFNPDKEMKVEFRAEIKDVFAWYWSDAAQHPVAHICDGHFLPFRAGISLSRDITPRDRTPGDIVYDNINYGATTVCVIFSDAGKDKNDALINLMLLAKNMGVKMLFYKDKILQNGEVV